MNVVSSQNRTVSTLPKPGKSPISLMIPLNLRPDPVKMDQSVTSTTPDQAQAAMSSDSDCQVILGDGTIHNYGSQQPVTINSTARRAIVLRFRPTSTTIWPGEFLEVGLTSDAPPDSVYALEPRTDVPSVRKLTASQLWLQPTMVSSVAGKIRIPNLIPEPHFLNRNEHFYQVHAVYTPEVHSTNTQLPVSPPPRPPVHQTSTKHSVNVTLDPNKLLPQDIRAKFTSLMEKYDHIFDPYIKGYNGRRLVRSQSKHWSCGTSPTKGQATNY